MILFQNHGVDLGLETVVILFLRKILIAYKVMITSYSDIVKEVLGYAGLALMVNSGGRCRKPKTPGD